MTSKDWVLLFVPLISNLLLDGVLLFGLNKFFEKRQRINAIAIEYATILRQKIDVALMDHANATRLANEKNDENDSMIGPALTNFVNHSLDVYYYFVQNKDVLKKLEKTMQEFGTSIKTATDYYHQNHVADYNFSSLINTIRDFLLTLKSLSIRI